MIPNNLKERLDLQEKNHAIRPNDAQAKTGLKELGIDENSEFGLIYRHYYPSNFQSNTSHEFLGDIAEPYNEVLEGTRFAYETWELPGNFIAFTSMQGEGCYLLDRNTGGVWDFDLAEREAFMSGNTPPTWLSFYEFLAWYLS
ncbi:SMI1/KNR4 family protein [Pseudomonas sp. NPDC089406]|uniref:SMI1/KNR4 family protein n=1 Tax=Pseudomonas sp. NPDC089406 TaxID=3364463 RepID=UPI00384BC7BA